MNFVPYAIPVFLLMIVMELCWGLFKGNNTYRVNDSINSLSMGLLSTVTKFFFSILAYWFLLRSRNSMPSGLST